MKELTKPYVFRGDNAWGRTSVSTRQCFEVEASDVGRDAPNYLGYNHRTYRFTSADVGRKIERIAPPVPSWSFTTDEWIAKYATPASKAND